jgi:hypothetical protein
MARYAFVNYFENVENFDDAVKLKIKVGFLGEENKNFAVLVL